MRFTRSSVKGKKLIEKPSYHHGEEKQWTKIIKRIAIPFKAKDSSFVNPRFSTLYSSSNIIQKLRIIFLIHHTSPKHHNKDICQHQKMKPNCRNCRFNYNFSEVADKKVDWIQKEKILHKGGICFNRIKNRR